MMKKLFSILVSFALACGLMVPTMAFADDEIGTVAIDYNGQRINLKPQINEAAHSLLVKFQVQVDDGKYQDYVSAGFTLSNEARSTRIAQSDVSGSTVTAVVSNGESPLPFSNNTLFLGTLTINVNAKLAPSGNTGAKIVVLQMDTTDHSFGATNMHAMDTRDDSGSLIDSGLRSASFTINASAYTGTELPGSNGAPASQDQNNRIPSDNIAVGLGQMADGVTLSEGDQGALSSLGSDLVEKVREQIEEMLAGKGVYPGLTSEQLQKIAEVIDAAGGNLDDINVAVTPVAKDLDADEAAEDVALMDRKFSGASMMGIYDLGVTIEVSYDDITTGPLQITSLFEPIVFTVSVPEGSLATMNAAVGYVHDGTVYSVDKGVKPILQSSTVQFPASQFSVYAVYGKEKAITPTTGPSGSLIPLDGSSLFLIIGFGCLALIACIAAVFTIRKRKAQL